MPRLTATVTHNASARFTGTAPALLTLHVGSEAMDLVGLQLVVLVTALASTMASAILKKQTHTSNITAVTGVGGHP